LGLFKGFKGVGENSQGKKGQLTNKVKKEAVEEKE